VASTRALAHAPWSASKVQTALRCPRLFYYRYIDKLKEPEVMPETRVGKALHAALESALLGMHLPEALAGAREALETPLERDKYDNIGAGVGPFLERIQRFRHRRRVYRSLIEYSLAIREDFTVTSFYSKDAFYRGIFDAAFLYEDSIALIDHKTGERREDVNIVEQLQGYAVLAAMAFKQVQRFWLGIHWVADQKVDWGPAVSVADVNQHFLPQLVANIEAAALVVQDGPRPEVSSWCERCSYRSVCPEGQRVRFEPVDDDLDSDEDL